MEILHKGEDPGSVIHACFTKTFPDIHLFLPSSSVDFDSVVCELAFRWSKPLGRQWFVGQKEESYNGDKNYSG